MLLSSMMSDEERKKLRPRKKKLKLSTLSLGTKKMIAVTNILLERFQFNFEI